MARVTALQAPPPLGFLLLFAYLCLAFFHVAQYRMWLMERLLLFLSIVVFLRVRSALSPTLFLLFINDLLTCTSNSSHSYADDSTLPSSTHFNSAPSFTSRIASRLNLSDSILADLDRISDWGRLNLVKFNSLKLQLLQISL